jgi:hypothetical protein
MTKPIRIRSGKETFTATIVGVDPNNGQPNWYNVRMGSDALDRGATLRFSLRRNGRYVVQGGDRDTGSYIIEEDLQP